MLGKDGREDALERGYSEVLTAAGWMHLRRWAVDTRNLRVEETEDGPAMVGPWRDLTPLEELIQERDPNLEQMKRARDRWPLR